MYTMYWLYYVDFKFFYLFSLSHFFVCVWNYNILQKLIIGFINCIVNPMKNDTRLV